MRPLTVASVLLGLLVTVPLTAIAQERLPAARSAAASFDVGSFVPQSDELSTSMVLNAAYEYYLTPRVSLRTGFGWSNPAFSAGATNSLMQLPLRIDGLYNWEHGRWHPFVSGGVGLYFLQFRSDLISPDDTDTRVGVSSGGGLEYYFHRAMAIKGEGRAQWVSEARGEEPSGVAVTIGLKTFF